MNTFPNDNVCIYYKAIDIYTPYIGLSIDCIEWSREIEKNLIYMSTHVFKLFHQLTSFPPKHLRLMECYGNEKLMDINDIQLVYYNLPNVVIKQTEHKGFLELKLVYSGIVQFNTS